MPIDGNTDWLYTVKTLKNNIPLYRSKNSNKILKYLDFNENVRINKAYKNRVSVSFNINERNPKFEGLKRKFALCSNPL